MKPLIQNILILLACMAVSFTLVGGLFFLSGVPVERGSDAAVAWVVFWVFSAFGFATCSNKP